MIRTVEPMGGSKAFKVMIIDPYSLAVINSICTMYDIMQENVSLVEDLTKRREPLQKMEALYVMRPIEASVQLAINDFSIHADARRNIKLYRAAHLVFLSSVPDALLEMIGPTDLGQNVRTLKELNLDFLVFESQVFHTNHPQSIPALFGAGLAHQQQRAAMLRECVTMLSTFCVTVGERPYIRHCNTDLAADFAEMLEVQIAGLNQSIPTYPPERALKSRSTLLILCLLYTSDAADD